MLERYLDELIALMKKNISDDDPSHDVSHILRVLKLADHIGAKEGGDMDIIIPIALFHDLVTYPKNDERNKLATDESAMKATMLLEKIPWYPKEKIVEVAKGIQVISFSKGLPAENLESKIVQDADMLESTGAISIMRTFTSSGKMNRLFYHPTDPFAEDRELDDLKYSIDLFYTRLTKVEERMNTETGKRIAKRRIKFLYRFLEELRAEIEGT